MKPGLTEASYNYRMHGYNVEQLPWGLQPTVELSLPDTFSLHSSKQIPRPLCPLEPIR
jgi:hypothetical protein